MSKTLWEITWYLGNKRHENIFEGDKAALAAKEWIKQNGWLLYEVKPI